MKKNIIIVAHKYLPHPDDDYTKYLREQKADNLLHIRHSFPDAKDRKSYYSWYKEGELYKKVYSADFVNYPDFIICLKELFFTCYWIIKSKIKWDYYIGMDGLCVLFGLILKKLGRSRKIIYWNIDFVPIGRFKSNAKNFAYHFVNKIGYKNADEMWDLSPRMYLARKKHLDLKKKDYKKLRVVSYGVWFENIKSMPYAKSEKNTAVFMGHLLPHKGLELVLEAIPLILKKNPDFSLKIIGDGSHKPVIYNVVDRLNIKKHVRFMGRLNNKRMYQEIAKSAIAFAPYSKAKDSYTYYADPGKVKTYLACGVPVLLTDVPWNAEDIQKHGAGLIINEEPEDVALKTIKLMDPVTNKKYRANALDYARKFNYEYIFKDLL